MATKKEVLVTIDEEGNTSIEALGYTDGTCRTVTEDIEKALGAVTNRKMKPGGACDVKQTVKA